MFRSVTLPSSWNDFIAFLFAPPLWDISNFGHHKLLEPYVIQFIRLTMPVRKMV
jgi:hypothetical protein